VSNKTKTWRERLDSIPTSLVLPFAPIIWPFSVVSTLRANRELARLTGTCYQFEDHYRGYQQTDWKTVLTLDLAPPATLILVGPTVHGQAPDPLAEPRDILVAAGRIRGPLLRTVRIFPGIVDFAMILFWILALFVLALVLHKK
jgi:hypothetical protein